jgi:hypothetical protein
VEFIHDIIDLDDIHIFKHYYIIHYISVKLCRNSDATVLGYV